MGEALSMIGPTGRPFALGLRADLGAPQSFRKLGFREEDLDPIAELATVNPYWALRTVEREGVRDMLQSARSGTRPEQRDR